MQLKRGYKFSVNLNFKVLNFTMGPVVRGNKAPKSGPSRTEITSAKPDKKPFDKKKWREGKYSNKLKGNIKLLTCF